METNQKTMLGNIWPGVLKKHFILSVLYTNNEQDERNEENNPIFNNLEK
jgi:hypothetical protein